MMNPKSITLSLAIASALTTTCDDDGYRSATHQGEMLWRFSERLERLRRRPGDYVRRYVQGRLSGQRVAPGAEGHLYGHHDSAWPWLPRADQAQLMTLAKHQHHRRLSAAGPPHWPALEGHNVD